MSESSMNSESSSESFSSTGAILDSSFFKAGQTLECPCADALRML